MGFKSRVAMKLKLGLVSGMLTLGAGYLQAAPGVLAQLPLFLATPVQPNIFFLLDDSGSMDWEVLRRSDGGGSGDLDFTPNDSTEVLELCSGYNVLMYDPTTLTDPQKDPYTPWFGLDSSGNPFTNASPTRAPVNPYTGATSTNCDYNGDVYNNNGDSCNLLTGFGGNGARYYPWTDSDNDGQYDSGECSTTPVYVSSMTAAQQQNYANWFSYYRKREYVMKRAVSEIIEGSTERMGLGVINNYVNSNPHSDNRHLTKRTFVGTPIADIDDLTIPINATAVANKVALIDNLLGVNSYGGTPLRLGLEHTGQYFEGLMNSGALFGGTSAPPNDPDSALGSSPILNATLGGTCQQNFAIVMSDGFWNGGNPSSAVGNADGDGSSIFDRQSYNDGASLTLADVAMHYYERDLLPIANEVPIVGIDVAPGDVAECSSVPAGNESLHPNCFDTNTAQHLVTYTVAFGVRGTIPDTDGSGNPCKPDSRDDVLGSSDFPNTCAASLTGGWPIPSSNSTRTVDDMMHAAWNGRGQFLSAKNPAELISSLQNAIDDIADRNPASMSAVAVDGASIVGGGNVVRAKFDTTYWSGELYSYVISGTGAVNTTPTWEAHSLLDSRGYSTRIAVTYNGTAGIPFNFPADYTNNSNFGTSEISQDQLDDLMVNAPFSVSTTDPAQIAANQIHGEELVAYLKGDSTNEGKTVGKLRDRGGHKLGDIIHSSPVYVGDPDPYRYYDPSYQAWANNTVSTGGAKGRREMIYVGANDGGLHAFDASTGEELFVYFPKAVFSDESRSGLHYLADRGYEHRYYVDGDITVAEVYADIDGSGARWRTVLIGMLRGGGRSVFAIDVSDPRKFSTPADVASNILWEFSHTELGFTFGKATIARMNSGRWAAIFGNGYHPGNASTGEAALFIKYLDRAIPSYTMISTGVGTNPMGDCLDPGSSCNGLSTPAVADLGGDYVADRIYAGDLEGNLWAFDVSSTNPTSWGLDYSSPLFTARDASGQRQPITSKPAVTLHPTERHGSTSPNAMLFFGTGQYLTENDVVLTDTNSFYGIWDNGSPVTSARSSELIEQTVTQGTLAGNDVRTLSNNPVNYTTHRGWFIDLPDAGERVVSRPIAIGRVVVYSTIVPAASLCSSTGGYSWFMVHELIDGSEPDYIAFDANGDGVFDANDQIGGKNVSGKKSGELIGTLTDVTGANGTLIIYNQGGELIDPTPSVARRTSWGRFDMQ